MVGGVISGVGKGISVSAIGKILQARGLKVTALKIDPYVNVDAGTMNPTEHGEVFVLDDGDECDQDMGNYERFLDVALTRLNYMTTGRVYKTVIERERNLEYKGKCVQVVPHIPLEVIRRIKEATNLNKADIAIIEIGGTVGEYENILFLEAIRMMKIAQPEKVMTIMVSYVPMPEKVGEMKTKPTQHAVRLLNGAGIQPDIILARSSLSLDEKRKEKIALFCNVEKAAVISAPDVESVYEIPLNFEKDNLSDFILRKFKLRGQKSNLTSWRKFDEDIKKFKREVSIAIVGKYFETGDFVLADAYLSVIEAIKYSCYAEGRKPKIDWLNAKDFEGDAKNLRLLNKYDGIIVPGGFGSTGVEGKISVIQYVREKKIPYLGICYGMQLMVVEFARNVAKLAKAHTREVDSKSPHPVIDIMSDQKDKLSRQDYGGSMRLGAYRAILRPDTLVAKAYGTNEISERHRHRYEVNSDYIAKLEASGLIFSGRSPNGVLMEVAELPESKHPFFVGTQFHPEFKAHPLSPHPIFDAFIKASIIKGNNHHK